jgi:hypothetical protein
MQFLVCKLPEKNNKNWNQRESRAVAILPSKFEFFFWPMQILEILEKYSSI